MSSGSAPMLLGGGVRLFDNPGDGLVRLEPVAGKPGHWYRVAG
ncbi:hypothetical protein ACFVH6_03005 [Spirillospora sp. NPDC127200]